MTTENLRKTYDAALSLKAGGLVAATAAQPIILDLGNAFMDADLVIEVTALEIAGNDEIYTISLEGSNDPTMATASVELARTVMGNNASPSDSDSNVGRHIVPFNNQFEGVYFRYVRLHVNVVGLIATGINFSAFLAKKN